MRSVFSFAPTGYTRSSTVFYDFDCEGFIVRFYSIGGTYSSADDAHTTSRDVAIDLARDYVTF
jgi:hypothetical protein